jgi:outer membrane protein assembly factor BamB
MRRRICRLSVCACVSALCLTPPARAVITALTPLKQVLDKEQLIFVAKVGQVLPDKPAIVLERAENLKGEAPFERLPVNLTGDSEAAKGKHTEALLERVERDLPVIVFASKRGKRYVAFGYTNGTWFQMEGRVEQDDGKEVVRWSFLHCEPYLRRTFKGATEELKQTIVEGLKDKKEPPAPNEKEPPGLGPPVTKKTGSRQSSDGSQQLALSSQQSAVSSPHYLLATADCQLPTADSFPLGVIQLPFLGAIAALAALFPAVFGGMALMMRRWLVALSTASLLSILFFIQTVFPKWLTGTWLSTQQGFWLTCAAIAALAGLWAARRYRRSVQEGKADDMQPRRLDRIVLVVLSLAGLVGVFFALRGGDSLWSSPWQDMLVAWIPVVAAAYFAMTTYIRVRKHPFPRPAAVVSAEMVMLWGLAFSCGLAGALEAGRAEAWRGPAVTQGQGTRGSAEGTAPRVESKPLWVFEPKDGGAVWATPCVCPAGVIVAVGHKEGLSEFGRVYALDAQTGQEHWRFDNDEEMKWVFSSPVYADGRIYVGEGQHKDNQCRLYCLDAATGKKLWDFLTNSHTESTPCVGEGKVVFGAGNDGIYCLDVKTGSKVWHFAGERGLHVDANPIIKSGRVYAGSGLSRTHQVNRMFCLDLQTGNEVWGERVEYSAYGAPAVHDGVVYFGIGNGNFSEDKEPKVGMVLARKADTGEVVWNRSLPNSVVCKPAVDAQHVYVGTRDHHYYALDHNTGEVVWKSDAGGPVLASPVVDACSLCRRSDALYAAGSTGRLAALSPATGEAFWTLDLRLLAQKGSVTITATPVVLREEVGALVRRKVLLGAGVAANDRGAMTARLYCFQDETRHAP